MTTKHYVKDKLQISEEIIDDRMSMVVVSVPYTEANSVYDYYNVYKSDEPYLRGEDYPVLVKIWDNQEDDIYDTL